MPVSDITAVVPGSAYTTADVAALFRVTPCTVLRWIAAGTLQTLPQQTPKSRHRVAGVVILTRWHRTDKPVPASETGAERVARTKAKLAEIRRLARCRPAVA